MQRMAIPRKGQKHGLAAVQQLRGLSMAPCKGHRRPLQLRSSWPKTVQQCRGLLMAPRRSVTRPLKVFCNQ